jgi:hypothetical protein
MTPSEVAGTALGLALAPLFSLATRWRGERVFHPSGVLTAGHAVAKPGAPCVAPLAERLQGAVIVRWSGGAHADPKAPQDVLGCAIRFRHPGPLDELDGPDDQDLLTLTAPSILGLAQAIKDTDVSSVETNIFFALGSFRDRDLGKLQVRIVPRSPSSPREGSDRHERLLSAVEQGDLLVTVEVRGPITSDAWVSVVALELTEFVGVEPRVLSFTPFRTGRGLEPAGFLHAIRRPVYAAAQAARR